ncbi:sensor histidine kinase [Microbacterium resistens]
MSDDQLEKEGAPAGELPRGESPRRALNRFRLEHAEGLHRAERVALIALVSGSALIDLALYFAAPSPDLLRTALSIATTLTFLLHLWSPTAATIALGATVTASMLLVRGDGELFAAAIGALLVTRLATPIVLFAYIAGFLVLIALSFFAQGRDTDSVIVAVALIIAVAAGALGLGIRAAYARRQRLEHELAASAEKEREAVLAERSWIAGELHDSIAHHLTIVAMHAQLLDDEATRPTSQDAIRSAARKALSDLHFVIELAKDAPRGTEVGSGDLSAAVAEAREEFEAAGHPVTVVGDPADERIPRGAEIILARVVRESATNVLKYAAPGDVRLAIVVGQDDVRMSIRSPRPATPRRDLPSTGTGLNRMAERVLGVSGEFHAGEDGEDWLVSIRLPLAGTAVAAPAE